MNQPLVDAYRDWLAAEDEWMRQIKSNLKGRPGDVRYTRAAEGQPGTVFNTAHQQFVSTGERWRTLWWESHHREMQELFA